ncbi:hypothetical protein GUITHDRAFT_151017 [Guillardia theta CCMP2712]|uniref:RWP-RK domain-containing protein n=1 Tax=Guillardia theta (strain CCMP2712) TaxID=905079 RepID=L1JRP0_GUITC|nr:hypothetical protein GUITHDRAFT_151017 [Guillardia theta CCMP2712]EKX51231.1 hypothetical protein GUITHDRAFT_151017 [Guillardia theta CCMP2712]|mmetsp:Transcript_3350/g.11556  ORF Transcript_3350/g.11556 Transcript_3350/m.11556 type:complete len:225 (-) Transcript_3350:61-735(-)|eukprot:XP_005838211.1 hypothetical protein GUITHDRAFT_151017 [Guillardia theta CCMP2712]
MQWLHLTPSSLELQAMLDDCFADHLMDQSPSCSDAFFCLPLPEVDSSASLPDSPLDPVVPEDLLVLFEESQDAWLEPASLMACQRSVAMPEETLQHPHDSFSLCSPEQGKPRPHRRASAPARPPVVRVQSRQSFFQSDKPVEITLELLADHFHESLEVAAAKIGIGKSTMKLVCRQLGVDKWPYKFGRAKGKKAGRRMEGRVQLQASQAESSTDTEGSGVDMYL